jgi:hypothetical protein
MFLPNALAEIYQEWRRHGIRRWRSPRFFPVPKDKPATEAETLDTLRAMLTSILA